LVDHTRRVVEELRSLLRDSLLSREVQHTLVRAAERHDWGKAHPVFQETMHRDESGTELLAKRIGKRKHKVPHFRHELASALAMLTVGSSDLAAYLAAAHHGRIRMSIRSMPGEQERNNKRTARGIQDGAVLPACELAPGLMVPEAALSLAIMDFGALRGSWTDRVLRLRDEYGPFRLAFLETLLRAADEKASADPRLQEAACTD